ncbi:hypothetical protein Pint_16754 [Pistacia integerrima]|uniref:Uncharacterized protein n=1 Tax=Pistacia integerrima TaxID=434235 RepID=A0ACC0ZDR3_9ROSI|nr:hypothetical protein Pint_16754 [Pistacia integerrima]
MEDERLQRLHNSAAEGNVDALFSILAEDPYVLERIDEIPFVTTPLHTAASWGKVHFMLEIVNLKPSFASKQDHLGRSPLHLALEGKKLQEGRSPPDLDLEGKYQEVVGEILRGAKAKRASQLHPQRKPPKSLVDYFRGDLSFGESILKRLGLRDQIIKTIPLKVRNAILVVALLITTATYETAPSPPRELYQGVSKGVGNLQPANNSTAISNTTTTTIFRKGPSKQWVDSAIVTSRHCLNSFTWFEFS